MQKQISKDYSLYDNHHQEELYYPNSESKNANPDYSIIKGKYIFLQVMRNPNTLIFFLLILILSIGYWGIKQNSETVFVSQENSIDSDSKTYQDSRSPMGNETNSSLAIESAGVEESSIDNQPAQSANLDPVSSVSDNSSSNNLLEAAPLKGTLSVIGNPIAGELLKIIIHDYDPDLEYTLDFGNGERLKVLRETSYRYLVPGPYRMRLRIANDEGKANYTAQFVRIQTLETEESPTIVSSEAEPIENSLPNPNLPQTLTESPAVEKEPAAIEEKPKEEIDLSSFEEIKKLEPSFSTETEISTPEIAEVKPKKSLKAPLSFAEKMPSFPGGSPALKEFFKDAIQYPVTALENEVEGKVYVRFIVNPDGSISKPTVIKGIGFGCDKEALKVISRMPKWIPGEQDGFKVQVVKTLPINFRLK